MEGDGIDSTSSLPSLFVAVFAESVSADSLFNFKIKFIYCVLHIVCNENRSDLIISYLVRFFPKFLFEQQKPFVNRQGHILTNKTKTKPK